MASFRSRSNLPVGLGALMLAGLVLTGCVGGGGSGGGPAASSRDRTEQPGEFAADSTMAAIQERGKLIVGIRLDAPPFAYVDPNTGLTQGFDVEIARLIASGIFGAQIEGKVEFLELDPRDRELALSQGRIDIAMGRYAITVARKQFADFAGPYYIAKQSVIAPARGADGGSNSIRSVPQLSEQRLCVVPASTNLPAVTSAIPNADLTTQANSVEECGAQVLNGNVAALVADSVDVKPMLRTSARTFTEFDLGAIGNEPYGIGVSKQELDFRQFINDRLEVIEEDGRWDDAFERTVGSDVDARQPPVQRY